MVLTMGSTLEALALAQAANLAEEEVEVLLALALLSSSRRGIGNRGGYLHQAEEKIGAGLVPIFETTS